MAFKVGDKVVCVNNTNYERRLPLGSPIEIVGRRGELVDVVLPSGEVIGAFAHRFRPAKEHYIKKIQRIV